eukprot:8388747-Alexandrium_andersonii.AAC.1
MAGQPPVVRPFQLACACRVKNAVVPSACAAQRRDAWDEGFFGCESVLPTAPRLGCALTPPGIRPTKGAPATGPPSQLT